MREVTMIVTTSWDDGSIFDLKIAELLNRHQLKGTFYVPERLFAHPLQREDIIRLDEGHEIGCHTSNHVELTKVPIAIAGREIGRSKEYMENLVGHYVPMFSYPSGMYNAAVKRLVREAGFAAARTTKSGNLKPPRDPFAWNATVYASYASPFSHVAAWVKTSTPLKAFYDWETRAKCLFDTFIETGGVYHLWGHSLTFEMNLEWDRLDRVLAYVARRGGVRYLTNGQTHAAIEVVARSSS